MRPGTPLRFAARSVLGAALAGPAVLSSCLELPDDVVWSSDHFRYHTRDTETSACSDILATLEEHAQVVHDALGMEWDAGEVVDYYKYDGIDDFQAHASCGVGAACTDVRAVRTSIGFEEHELIHAYLAKLGMPPWLLIEGSAVAIACQLVFYDRPTVGWREAFESDHHSSTLYGAGGWLISRLLATRDAALFVSLYGTLPDDASADDFAAAFEDIYGENLDDVWDEMIDAEDGAVFCPWECSRPAIPLDGSETKLDAVCGETVAAKTLVVDDAADLILSGAGEVSFDVRSCDRVESLGDWVGTSGTELSFTSFIPVSAGTHFLQYYAPPAGEQVTISARASEEPLVTSDCATAAPALVEASSASLDVYFPPSVAPASIRLSMGAARSMSWIPPFVEGQSAASLCEACGSAPASCVPLSSEPLTVTIGPESVLTAEAGPGVLVSFDNPPP